jgi:hypothetical protein
MIHVLSSHYPCWHIFDSPGVAENCPVLSLVVLMDSMCGSMPEGLPRYTFMSGEMSFLQLGLTIVHSYPCDLYLIFQSFLELRLEQHGLKLCHNVPADADEHNYIGICKLMGFSKIAFATACGNFFVML